MSFRCYFDEVVIFLDKKGNTMNDLTDSILQFTYNPAINVYIVWILGAFATYKLFTMHRESVDSLDDATRESYESSGLIKNGEYSKHNKVAAIFALPFLGVINDFIFMMIGGPAILVYNKLWWGQFLPLSMIMDFMS